MAFPARTTRGGAAFLILMGMLLVAAGGLFTWGLWHAGMRALETHKWTAVPCRIISSTVYSEKFSSNDPTKWRAAVQYEYQWEGKSMTGNHVRRSEGPSPHRANAEEISEKWPAGTQTQCWVNPADPKQAVLQHETKAPFYTLWWPLLFVAGGLGIVFAALRRQFRS